MPIFRTTKDIFEDGKEYFDENWMDKSSLYLPPNKVWDYKREIDVDDVDLWEVLYEESGGVQLYAAWEPYAEFYLLIPKFQARYNIRDVELYYGKGAQSKLQKRIKELGIPLHPTLHWVENEDMWLYS